MIRRLGTKDTHIIKKRRNTKRINKVIRGGLRVVF